MGRDLVHFTEDEVYQMRDINDVGKWLYEMYSGYWERNYKDRRAATNDTCAVLAMRFPQLFKYKRASVFVDTGNDTPGRLVFRWNRKGNAKYAYAVNRKKFHQLYFSAISKYSMFDLRDYLNASAEAKINQAKNIQLSEDGKKVIQLKPKAAKKPASKTATKKPATKSATKPAAKTATGAKTTSKAKTNKKK